MVLFPSLFSSHCLILTVFEFRSIVCINPHELHINDPKFYDEVYAAGGRRRNKYIHSVPMFGVPTSMVATVDHDHHRYRRGLVNNFFSKKAILDIESMVQEKQLKLTQRFEDAHREDVVISIDAAFSGLTSDVVSLYLYGACFDFLSEKSFENDVREVINEISEAFHFNRFFPVMLHIVEALPHWLLVKVKPAAMKLLEMQETITQHSTKAIEEMSDVQSSSKRKTTMFAALTDPGIVPHERTLKRLRDEALINRVAGTETSARAMSVAISHISRDNRVKFKLREELRRTMPTPTSSVTWSQLENIPYMNAVVKESLRLSYGAVVRSPRIATDETLVYGDYHIPPGTPVSMSSYHIHRNPDLFPQPEKFLPERWIQAAERGVSLDKFLVAFSKGSRSCLGMNLALLELYTTIAYCIRRFDFEVCEMAENNMTIVRDYGIGQPDKGQFSVQVKVANTVKD